MPAPVLSARSVSVCTATLSWTLDNPDDLSIYNFQYRARFSSAWSGSNNISGGGATRSAAVTGDMGNTFQVRATALSPGHVFLGDPSNSATVPVLLASTHSQCRG